MKINIKRILWITVVINILILIGIVARYIYNFKAHPYSNDPADWGAFGDYIGGILNPVFAFSNLILFIVITLQVSKIGRNQAFEQMRNDSYMSIVKSINTHFYKAQNIIKDRNTDNVSNIKELLSDVTFFIKTTKHLFSGLSEEEEYAKNFTDSLTSLILKLEFYISDRGFESEKDAKESLKIASENSIVFISEIQKLIINKYNELS